MDTIITFIRHGETAWNRNDRWQGHADVPLSTHGQYQARCLAARLRDEQRAFDHLYTSDLSRALATAQIVGQALGLLPSPLLELREIDLGSWSGLNRQEIAARYPKDWARIAAGEDIPRGGAESFADLQRRVINVITHLAQEHPGQHLCIVTHGGVIRAVLLHILKLSWQQRQQIAAIDNTSLSTISIGAEGWRIDAINDVAHLQHVQPALDSFAPTGEAQG